jgi:hypothetical protein
MKTCDYLNPNRNPVGVVPKKDDHGTDYKGIYFNNDQEENYYEFGAHFKYTDLYNRLEKIFSALPQERKADRHSYFDSSNVSGN